MSDLRRVRQYVTRNFRLLRRETLEVMVDLIDMHSRGSRLTEQEIRVRLGAAAAQNGPRGGGQMSGAVAVIPLYAVIDQKMGSMGAISGGTSVDGFLDTFRGALNDNAVKAIVIDCDSPGGSVYGVPEAAAEILASRGKKPIVAVANPQIASAAYYLCCAADTISCIPSGEVGSVGVFAVHDDYSAMNEQVGYTPTYVYARKSPHKVEFNPDQPLAADARAYLQQQIDQTCEDFLAFVAKARKLQQLQVEQTFGGGRMLLAPDALKARMIDRIETLDQAVARLDKSSATRILAGATSPKGRTMGKTLRYAGHIPKDVSEEVARKGADWKPATAADDFPGIPEGKAFEDLSEADQNRIAGHYAWSKNMPPEAFGDLKCQHHRASDGRVVQKGMDAAYDELDSDPEIPSADKVAVRAHLDKHQAALDEAHAPDGDPDDDGDQADDADGDGGDQMDDQSDGDSPVHARRAGRRAAVSRVAGVVPKDVSDKLAPKDTPWSAPSLKDFTDKAWGDLSDDEKRKIAGHFAWAKEMPPASYGDLKLPHHRPSDGAVVFKGVTAALGALNGARGTGVDIPSEDKPKVEAHLKAHEKDFEKDDASAESEDLRRRLAYAESQL